MNAKARFDGVAQALAGTSADAWRMQVARDATGLMRKDLFAWQMRRPGGVWLIACALLSPAQRMCEVASFRRERRQ